MNLQTIADNINILADFCGKRDLLELTGNNIADIIILFGGSIPCGADIAAYAIQKKLAPLLMISGGQGHTTQSLRLLMNASPDKMEADIFADYIKHKYNINTDLIERESTNCGNNVTNCLKLLQEKTIPYKRLLIIQDATMQKRMEAGFQKYLGHTIKIINYASYNTHVIVKNQKLAYSNDTIYGMWDIQKYITLLISEIPRLHDDLNGYGPNGKNFIAHVDIPTEVMTAFEYLKKDYGYLIRGGNICHSL